MRGNKTEALPLRIHLMVEAVFLLAIETAQFLLPEGAQTTKNIMFSAVAANTLFALWLWVRYGRRCPDSWQNILALGLGLTCLADVLLTLTGGERMFLPGFAAFCAVEAVYAVYLRPDRRNLLLRGAAFLLALAAVWAADRLSGVPLLTLPNALGILNLTLLAGNVVCAWLAFRRKRAQGGVSSPLPDPLHSRFPCLSAACLFAAGLSLFLCCDICVMLELFTTGTAHRMAAHLVWPFYLPAQVLIVCTYRARILYGSRE